MVKERVKKTENFFHFIGRKISYANFHNIQYKEFYFSHN